jgi:hypothetical protein
VQVLRKICDRLWISISHCKNSREKPAREKTKKMMNDANQKADPSENEDSKNLDGMAKAFIVSVAWSYAEALERTKRAEHRQKSAPESQPESQEKPVDRTPENN